MKARSAWLANIRDDRPSIPVGTGTSVQNPGTEPTNVVVAEIVSVDLQVAAPPIALLALRLPSHWPPQVATAVITGRPPSVATRVAGAKAVQSFCTPEVARKCEETELPRLRPD